MSLSDKKFKINSGNAPVGDGYLHNNVKEFIKELKEKINMDMDVLDIFVVIDELAGEKLI